MNANGKWLVGGIVALLAVAVGGGVWMANKNSKTQKLENSNVPVVASPTPTSEVETESGLPAGRQVEVTVEGSNYKFSPANIKAKKGDTVRLTFRSAGGIHDLTMDEFEVQTNQIGEGEEEEVEFVADKVGTFEYYCSVAGHRAMGMTGIFVVE